MSAVRIELGTPGLSQTRFEARDLWPSAGGDDDHPPPGPWRWYGTSDDDFSHIFDRGIYFMIYNIECSIKQIRAIIGNILVCNGSFFAFSKGFRTSPHQFPFKMPSPSTIQGIEEVGGTADAGSELCFLVDVSPGSLVDVLVRRPGIGR